MTFTTHYFIGNQKWSGERIEAISWADAEYQASIKGVIVTGLLHWEEDYDNPEDKIIYVTSYLFNN